MSNVHSTINTGDLMETEATKKKETKDISEYGKEVQDSYEYLTKFMGKQAINNLPNDNDDWVWARAEMEKLLGDLKTYSATLFILRNNYKKERAYYRIAVEYFLKRFPPKYLKVQPDGTYADGNEKDYKYPEWVLKSLLSAQGLKGEPTLGRNIHYPCTHVVNMIYQIDRAKFEIVRFIAEKNFKDAKSKEDAAERTRRAPSGAAKAAQDAKHMRDGAVDPAKVAAELDATKTGDIKVKEFRDNLSKEKVAKYEADPDKLAERLKSIHLHHFDKAMLVYYNSKVTRSPTRPPGARGWRARPYSTRPTGADDARAPMWRSGAHEAPCSGARAS